MVAYAIQVKKDIARWAERGLIDARTADALSHDVDASRRASFGFGMVLAVLAAILFGAAILLFVAANWETMPRLARVALLFSTIAVGYVGGALLKLRGHEALAEALWLIGAAASGGSIALIGQMYHLPGDEAGAVLTWCIGTGLAAATLRSGPLTVATVALAAAWLFMRGSEAWDTAGFPHSFLLIAAALWLISYWTGSRAARHLLLLSLIAYVALFAFDRDTVAAASGLAAGSAALFALAISAPPATERVARIGGHLPTHCLVGFLAGMAFLQLETDEVERLVAAAGITFAGIVGALLTAGRDRRALRWIAYLGFAFELCFVYAVTLGTMLGTAGFLLAAALILGGLALVIIRVERRMAAPAEGSAA
ncbi:MAG TPA: DUF2157 domain-containing protein [Rhizobiaceae bacterium]|nr:DUF2157 domain-containing protein [Rhizobiaceae bacterium]